MPGGEENPYQSAPPVAPLIAESTYARQARPSRAPSATSGKPFVRAETLLVFDWDDTLLSSSWLAVRGLRLDSPDQFPRDVEVHLEFLQQSVIQLLLKARELGTVVIVTNAETGWVELSCKKFMPRAVAVVNQFRVFSARSTFEPYFPQSPADWKIHAFMQVITAAYTQKEQQGFTSRRNVLSFGDSVHERLAILTVTSNMPATHTKSIKFVERPTAEQLKRQVDLVYSYFEAICAYVGHLDLMLTIHNFPPKSPGKADGSSPDTLTPAR